LHFDTAGTGRPDGHGPANAPVILLLHGFPSSSRMFGTLIPLLADRYHLVAPDYPGFGNSDAPSPQQFAYTFETVADIVGTRRCMCWTPAISRSTNRLATLPN
jgi:pimeloyl-ACP methyl ester carboxylesterase